MKIFLVITLIFVSIVFSEQIEVKLKNGVIHNGELLNYSENDIFIKSNKLNRPILFKFSSIDYVIIKDKKIQENINKNKILEILDEIENEKISMDKTKKEDEEKKRTQELDKLKLEAQKRIEEKKIEKLQKMELFKSGDYKLFLACPNCGTINFKEDKLCVNCNKNIAFDLKSKKDIPYYDKIISSGDVSKEKLASLGSWHIFNGTVKIIVSGVGIISIIISAVSLEDWYIGHTLSLIPIGFYLGIGVWEINLGNKLIN